jgi:PrgI family protein
MQFQVPQFIETEDKIIGPFTLQQFVYIATGAGLTFFLFFFLNLWLWGFLVIPINAITISLAIGKINGIPLPKIVASGINYFWQPKFYLWKKTKTKSPEIQKGKKIKEIAEPKKPLGDIWQRLLTSKTPIPKREKTTHPAIFNQSKSHQEQYEVFRKITGEKEIARRIDYK